MDNNFKTFIYLGNRFIEYIYNDYLYNNLGNIKEVQSDVETAFFTKYIKPVLEKNNEEGLDMEASFNTVLAEACEENFKNGFKACLQFISECINCSETENGDTEG